MKNSENPAKPMPPSGSRRHAAAPCACPVARRTPPSTQLSGSQRRSPACRISDRFRAQGGKHAWCGWRRRNPQQVANWTRSAGGCLTHLPQGGRGRDSFALRTAARLAALLTCMRMDATNVGSHPVTRGSCPAASSNSSDGVWAWAAAALCAGDRGAGDRESVPDRHGRPHRAVAGAVLPRSRPRSYRAWCDLSPLRHRLPGGAGMSTPGEGPAVCREAGFP